MINKACHFIGREKGNVYYFKFLICLVLRFNTDFYMVTNLRLEHTKLKLIHSSIAPYFITKCNGIY